MRKYEIAIVGTSRHHTKSLLMLSAALRERNERNTAFVMCARHDAEYFTELARSYGVDVVSIDADYSNPSRSTESGSLSGSGIRRRVVAYVRDVVGLRDSKEKRLWMVFLRVVILWLYESSFGLWLRERFIVKNIESYKERGCEILEKLRPRAVLASSDRSPGFESAMLWAAQKNGIRVVLPYISSFAIEGALVYRRGANGRPIKGFGALRPLSVYRLVTYVRFRAQVYDGLFYQPPSMLNAQRKTSVASHFPWVSGHGASDIVCADSKHTADIFRSYGIADEKIRIVGGFSHDTLFKSYRDRSEIRNRLYRDLEFDSTKKLIAVAVPQYGEQGFLSSDRHWVETIRLVDLVSQSGQNVILALHPRHDRREYAFLAEKFDVRIAAEPLEKYLPACDLFLASYSSTLVWAVLCEVPSINFDFVGLNFGLYDYLNSVQNVKDISALLPAIGKTLRSEIVDFAEDHRELSRNEVFDGNTVARYESLVCGEQVRDVSIA